MMGSSLAFAGYNILFGFSVRGIDNAAHLGGLVGGFALGWLLALPVDERARRRLGVPRILAGLAALAVICTAGVRFTPRFDFRVADELAMREVLREFGPRERQFAAEHERAIAALQRDGDTAAFADWTTRVAVPFYKEWRARLAALELDPGRATDARRARLVEALGMKRDAYRDLTVDLRAGRHDAFQRFTETGYAIEATVRELESPR
jgi:rhomboid protease GluP